MLIHTGLAIAFALLCADVASCLFKVALEREPWRRLASAVEAPCAVLAAYAVWGAL